MAAAVAAVAVAVFLVGRSGNDDSRPAPTTTATTAPAPEPTTPTTAPAPVPVLPESDVRLLVADDRSLTVLDLGRGTSVALTLPDPVGRVSRSLVTTSGAVIVVQRAVAWTLDPSGSQPARVLGPAVDVLPADPRFVWLVDQRRDTVTRVSADGTSTRTLAVPIPDGMWASPLTEGFVATSADRWIRFDGGGRVVEERPGVVIASGGDVVVWLDRVCREPTCEIHVTDLGTGRDRVFELAAEPFPVLHDVELTHGFDGLVLGGDLRGDRSSYEIVLVALHEDELRVQEVATDLDTPPGVISAAERWVFWSRRRFGATDTSFTAYDLGTGEGTELDLPVRSIVTFVAF